jgi:pimeloyl-ACP methyl ester carboxylesterase
MYNQGQTLFNGEKDMTQKSGTLRVPGASLYFEIRGSGPMLLMIAGGDGGAAGFTNVANHLAGQYTVVTYDRRGSYRSSLDEPVEDMRLETHSNDAHDLLVALTAEPAYVFGSSAGALIGLDLTIRHPHQVRMLVAHEPPVEGLLPEFDQFQQELSDTFHREGGLKAMMYSMGKLGVTYTDLEPGIELPRRDPRTAADGQSYFGYTFLAVHSYRLDVAALKATPARVVLAAGSTGREYLGYRCTAALADRIGTTVVEFPSHHAGYVGHPKAFTEELRQVFSEESATASAQP